MKNLLAIVSVLLCISCASKKEPVKNLAQGEIFGTYYRIQFFDEKETDFSASYDSLFAVLNNSMSTYQKDSDISKINAGDSTVVVDTHFKTVFNGSKAIYEATQGFFDPTIGVIVNAWDFGPGGKIEGLDSVKIKDLMQSVGFNKVKLVEGNIQKQAGTFIDFNAIAKGYALDVIANFLESKGHVDYLIDIGGEIRAGGMNKATKQLWSVGIENPNFDGTQSYTEVIHLDNEAMATSGVYRKYKVDENGNKYSHIINTKTGYPSKTNVLSVSVIAKDCMTADAYATAFKAMGIDEVRSFLATHPELKVFFIYEENQELKTIALNNFPLEQK